jgi:hypothetical protein
VRSLSCGSDQYTCFFPLKFAPGEVMPPLTKIYLKRYIWGRSFPYNASHWNFKHLETLDLIGLPFQSFIAPADFVSMGSLRVLKIDGWLTEQLLSEILSRLPQLEQLELRCGLAYISQFGKPPFIYEHKWTPRTFDTIGESLQKLHSLRKLKIVKCDSDMMRAIFAGLSWEILAETCPLLETLELDLPVWDQEDMASTFDIYVEVRTFAAPRASC